MEPNPKLIIETERLILRRLTISDAADILHFVSDHSVARVTREIEPTDSGVKKFIKLQDGLAPFEKDKCFDLALDRRSDSKVIGLLTCVRKDHALGQIGWALGVDFRGEGYVTEGARALIQYCFETLDLHRVSATTAKRNRASWKIMESLGMRQEACLREAELRDGERDDTYVYGMLASEWSELNDG